jgi:hypothetical protein
MGIRTARDAARRWVLENAAVEPGFRASFYHGSTGWSPDDAVLPATSDVDVMVVLDDAELRTRPGKLRYEGVLLEVPYRANDLVRPRWSWDGLSWLAAFGAQASSWILLY